MLITKNECGDIYTHKGDYIIEKRLNKFSDNFKFKDFNKFDKNIKSKSESESNGNFNKENIIFNKENYFAPLDLDILMSYTFPNENQDINRNVDNFYFFHHGYLVKNLENTVFKFDLKRM